MEELSPTAIIEKAFLYMRLAHLNNAISLFENAIQLGLSQNNFTLVMQIQINLLRVWAEKENYLEISKLKVEIVESALQKGISLNSQFYYNLGICSSYQNNNAEAKLYFETAKAKASMDDLIGRAQVELGFAVIETECNNFDSAREYLEKAKAIIEGQENSRFKIMVLVAEGRVLRCQKKFDQALEKFRSALEIDKNKKDLFGYLYLLYELSLTYFELNNFIFSQLYLDLAISSCPEGELIRLEKLLKDLKNKLHNQQFEIILDKKERKLINKSQGEVLFNRQELIVDLLTHFFENQGKIFSKEELCKLIWNEDYSPGFHDNKIYVTIKRLRNILMDNMKHPKYILHAREGYFFNSSIKVAVQV